jgi:heme A synthase
VPEWLWALVVGVVVIGLVAYIWRTHEERDRERSEHIWDQIGRDSKSGMREIVHKCANALTRLRDVERRVGRLERHTKVDMREDEE